MDQEKLIWLSVMDNLVWKRNPVKLLVEAWTEKSQALIDIPKNRRLTQEHLQKERDLLAQMESAARKIERDEWTAVGERLNHLR